MIALLRAPIRLALLCGLMLAACQSPNVWKTRSLADLAVGETVRVDYRHQGCFVSGVTQRVEFARSEEGWTFETWLPEEGGDGMHLSTSSTSVDLAWRRGDRVLRVASWSRSMGADETEDWFAAPADPLTLQLQEAAARLGEGSPR
jgi:hypothetical protein